MRLVHGRVQIIEQLIHRQEVSFDAPDTMAAVVAELDSMDDATAAVFIRFQILDFQASAHADNGIVENAERWDNIVAMRQYEAELRSYSAHRGLPSDELLVPEPEEPRQEEEVVIENGVVVEDNGFISAMSQAAIQVGWALCLLPGYDTGLLASVISLPLSLLAVSSTPARQPPSSSWTESFNSTILNATDPVELDFNARTQKADCIVCSDSSLLAELYECPFPPSPEPHRWCEGCLEHLHRSALTDETLYPPRCCQHRFEVDNVEEHLTQELVEDFKAKREELDDDSRVYCHVSACSAYIAAGYRLGKAEYCPNHHNPTCTYCKNKMHKDDCPQDVGRQQVEKLAAQKGWQTCRSCNAIVDLDLGCNHMT